MSYIFQKTPEKFDDYLHSALYQAVSTVSWKNANFRAVFPYTEKTIRSALKSYIRKYRQISGKRPLKMGYRVYKFISVGRIYEKSNYLIKMPLSIETKTHLNA